MMAKAASSALKREIRHDEVTKQPYRGWHAVPRDTQVGDPQLRFTYVDIDDAPRRPMQKAFALRVSGMVDDGVQLSFDASHWNRINPTEEPLDVDAMMDLRDAVEWRKAAAATDDDDDVGDDEGSDPGEPTDPSST